MIKRTSSFVAVVLLLCAVLLPAAVRAASPQGRAKLILDSDMVDRWIDVSVDYGPDFGRSNGYIKQGPLGTQKVRIVNAIDQNKFWKLVYAGLSPAKK